MTDNEIKTHVEKILDKGTLYALHEYNTNIDIEYASMYHAPEISLNELIALRDLFGADDVKTNNDFSQTGCETCDYGSKYGYYIEIKKATKNIPKEDIKWKHKRY